MRRILRGLCALTLLASLPLPALAADPLPPGHPPISAAGAHPASPASATSSAPKAAHPTAPAPAGAAAPAPPSAQASEEPSQNPHATTLPQDESVDAKELPKGSIEALILDASRAPIAGVQVRLGIMFQRISEGEARSQRFAQTDAAGRVRFDGLNAGSDYSYRVTVASGPAEYASFPFNLGDVGRRVRLHVFPVTRDINEALVGMRGFVYIEPRDDVFVVELLYRIFNMGGVSWVPDQTRLRLPSGFKAFSSQASMTGVGFDAEPAGARLKGTFTPGQHEVSARFQVPKTSDASASFQFGGLPHTAEMRVIAEASSQMRLDIDGFDPAQPASNRDRRVLVTRRIAERGDELANGFSVSLSGLPTPGPGRWVAVFVAAGLALLGVLAARGQVRLAPGEGKSQDQQSARELLLSELVLVERAHREGELGPRAYAEARRTLLDALARLPAEVLAPRKKQRRAAPV